MSHSDAADIAVASLVLCGGLGLAIALTQCAGAAPGVPTKKDFASYSWTLSTCLQQPDKASAVLCAKESSAAFCSSYPDLCVVDAGADK